MEREQRTDRFTALEDYFSGYEVYDPAHSKIGKVGDLFVDENHEPEYVSVKTGFLGTKSTLIPWQIVEVRDEEMRLVVAADKDAVKGGPAFNDREITSEYENKLHSYYGLEGTRASEDRGLYGGHFGHSEGEHAGEVRPGTRMGDTETGDVRGRVRERSNDQEDLRQAASGVEDELRVPRTEAELRVGTAEREAGAVNMSKRVRTDRERLEVPTMRE
jgi:hypothetical protein